MEWHDAPHGPLHTAQLANGLTVVSQRDRALPDLHIELRYDVGSRHEGPGQHGLAHFLEHLMFLGTRRYPDFMGALLRNGARDVNASTSQDRSAFTMTIPRALLGQALTMEADRMTGLAEELDHRALADHLAVVRREEGERNTGPHCDATRLLFAHAYPPGHPYRHPAMGDTDALSRLTPEEVARFHRAHYRPGRATLVVIGDLSPATVVDTAAATLGVISVHASLTPPETDLSPLEQPGLPPRLTPTVTWTTSPRGAPPQAHALLHTPPYGAAEHPVYAVLAAVLGMGRGSRLFRRVVRASQAAQPASELMNAWELERGSSLMYGAFTATPGTTGARLLAEVRAALESVSQGLAPGELRRAVRLVRCRRLAALDDPVRRAESFATHIRVTGAAHHAYDAAEAIAAVTAEAVVHAAVRSTASATFLVHDTAARIPTAAAADDGVIGPHQPMTADSTW